VSAIKNFKVPNNVKDVRRFLSLTGFIRKFVENYSLITRPLTRLLRKSDQNCFDWGNDQQRAFNELIDKLCCLPVLVLYDFPAHHEVHADACAIGLAGVLLQSQDKTNWRPVCYFSRHCTDAELETLAVVETLQRFKVYILGKLFRLVTDCSAIAKVKINKE